jgi:hypothetical protein
MSDGRDALLRKQFERDVERAQGFSARMRARAKLFSHGWGEDPFDPALLEAELARVSQLGAAAALADAGRSLLANDQLEVLGAWLPQLHAVTPDDAEAVAVVSGMLAIRTGDNARGAEILATVPHPEAVALHGLALLQLGLTETAAARLEVLLAADALDEQGELVPTYLPETMPVLALFLTACGSAAEARLGRGDREGAARYALAARDAYRRYGSAEASEGPSREEVGALLARVDPHSA